MKQAIRRSGHQAITRRQLLGALPVSGGGPGRGVCGYALAGRGSFLPDYIRVLGIPMFGNATPYQTSGAGVHAESPPGIPEPPALHGRAERRRRRRHRARRDHGDLASQPVSLTDAQLASRYRFTVTVKIAFEDVKAQKTLWENPALSFSDEFELASRGTSGTDVSAFIGNERVAMDRLSTDFARSVVSPFSRRSDGPGSGRLMSTPRRNPQTDQIRQDRAALSARGRRSAVAP